MKYYAAIAVTALFLLSCSEEISVPPREKPITDEMPKGFTNDSIRFMDVMPNTKTDYKELVRIKNYGKTNIILDDWRVVDKEITKDEYSFTFNGTTLPGKDTLTVVNTTNKPFMRNEGDTLLLYNNKGELVDMIYWQNAEVDKLYKHQ